MASSGGGGGRPVDGAYPHRNPTATSSGAAAALAWGGNSDPSIAGMYGMPPPPQAMVGGAPDAQWQQQQQQQQQQGAYPVGPQNGMTPQQQQPQQPPPPQQQQQQQAPPAPQSIPDVARQGGTVPQPPPPHPQAFVNPYMRAPYAPPPHHHPHPHGGLPPPQHVPPGAIYGGRGRGGGGGGGGRPMPPPPNVPHGGGGGSGGGGGVHYGNIGLWQPTYRPPTDARGPPPNPGGPPPAGAAGAGIYRGAPPPPPPSNGSVVPGGGPVVVGGGGSSAGGAPVGTGGNALPAKRMLKITDKHGNPIDLSSTANQTRKSRQPTQAEQAGAKLMEAAKLAIAEGGALAVKRKEEEERLKREAQEKAKKEEEDRLKRIEEEQRFKREAEEKAKREAEERARLEAEEKARRLAEEKARIEAEEKAAKERAERERAEREAAEKRALAEQRAAEERAAAERRVAEERAAAERKAAEERAKAQAAVASSSSSSLQARLEPKMSQSASGSGRDAASNGPSSSEPAPPPAPSAPAPSLRPGSSFRPGGGLRPGGAGGLRPGSSSTGSALRPGGGLRPGAGRSRGLSPTPPSMSSGIGGDSSSGSDSGPSAGSPSKKRRVYTKQELLRFRDLDICTCRPAGLPDMTIHRGGGGGGGGGRNRDGGNRSNWQREAAPQQNGRDRKSSNNGGSQNWKRSVPLPRQAGREKGRGRGGASQYDDFGGPVAPLVQSENRWMPTKDTSAMVVTEKQVKSILNKMTKEKFNRLSGQMCDIPLLSFEMLTMMIHNVYEKAIYEPSFGDMYADLCVRLSMKAKDNSFVKIIESDEEPPTAEEEGGGGGGGGGGRNGHQQGRGGGGSGHTVFRWSNDVSTSDAEIIGPFDSPDECVNAALDPDNAPDPAPRGDLELELHKLLIQHGIFIKIMKPSNADDKFYVVFFPVEKKDECGQQLSKIFLSERECVNDGNKQNSFKRILLNKCEDEFNKQDIYVDWKKEKKDFETTKSNKSERDQAEQEEELEFRRMKIKKQMLGNIRFIGELYKKDMLKEKIMRYCIQSLLKLEEEKSGTIKNADDQEMDEEDHEALCNLFTTIGATIDKPKAKPYMEVYFSKMSRLSVEKSLNARSRFMYKDLIELRQNRWKSRREKETAKTLEEIREDVEREERKQAQQSAQADYRGGRGGGDRGGRGGRGNPGRGAMPSYREDSRRGGYGAGSARQRAPKPQVDEGGFTVVGRGGTMPQKFSQQKFTPAEVPSSRLGGGRQTAPAPAPPPPPKAMAAAQAAPVAKHPPLSKDKVELRAKNMRVEFMQDRNNIEELLLSTEDLGGTPDAGKTIVQVNVDSALDARDDEREAIISMLSILFKNGKLQKGDFDQPMADIVEFIDSFVVDSPRAFEYLGDMLAEFIHIGALDVAWLTNQCETLKSSSPMPEAAEKVVSCAVRSMKTAQGLGKAKDLFGSAAFGSIIGDDVWSSIKNEHLNG